MIKNFKLTKNEYLNKENKLNKKDKKGINKIINTANDTNIENMTAEDIEKLAKELNIYNKVLYDNSIKSLKAIDNHISIFISSISKINGFKNVLKGNKKLYSELSVMFNKVSEITSIMLLPFFDDLFTLDNYNYYVLPILNKLIYIVKLIESNDKKEEEKIPLTFYTTDKYFKKEKNIIEDIIFKIEYEKDSIDLEAAYETLKHLWSSFDNAKIQMEQKYTDITNLNLEINDLEATIKNSTPVKIFMNEMINGGLLVDIFEAIKPVLAKSAAGVAVSGAAATTGNGFVAYAAGKEAEAEAIKAGITIVSKLTGGAKKAALESAKLMTVSKTSLTIAKGAKIFSIGSLVLMGVNLAYSGCKTYYKLKKSFYIDHLYGVKDNSNFNGMKVTKVYSHKLTKSN